MPELIDILLLTGLAGMCIPLGGLLGRVERLRPNWLENEFRHFVIALGGGILLGAVAAVLVPEGVERMDRSLWSIPLFLAGGIGFFLLDRWLYLRGQQAPQLMGMLLDFIPEAIALGGMATANAQGAILLGILMGLQNLPEGFNAYRELAGRQAPIKRPIFGMILLALLGPLAGLLGYLLLSGVDMALGSVMLFASGGIVYLIFQDIAPQAKLARHWGPPLGAVIGFSIALFSEMMVTGA